jgi:signal transduction histidine kinase
MTFVRSSLDNLDNRPDDDDGDKEILLETIEDISHSCQTALSVLNDLLTFDKIESGQMNMELEMTHPWHYFHSASKPFRLFYRWVVLLYL